MVVKCEFRTAGFRGGFRSPPVQPACATGSVDRHTLYTTTSFDIVLFSYAYSKAISHCFRFLRTLLAGPGRFVGARQTNAHAAGLSDYRHSKAIRSAAQTRRIRGRVRLRPENAPDRGRGQGASVTVAVHFFVTGPRIAVFFHVPYG